MLHYTCQWTVQKDKVCYQNSIFPTRELPWSFPHWTFRTVGKYMTSKCMSGQKNMCSTSLSRLCKYKKIPVDVAGMQPAAVSCRGAHLHWSHDSIPLDYLVNDSIRRCITITDELPLPFGPPRRPFLPAIFWDVSQVPEDCPAVQDSAVRHAYPAVKLQAVTAGCP